MNMNQFFNNKQFKYNFNDRKKRLQRNYEKYEWLHVYYENLMFELRIFKLLILKLHGKTIL